jgi:hypothetical protein
MLKSVLTTAVRAHRHTVHMVFPLVAFVLLCSQNRCVFAINGGVRVCGFIMTFLLNLVTLRR